MDVEELVRREEVIRALFAEHDIHLNAIWYSPKFDVWMARFVRPGAGGVEDVFASPARLEEMLGRFLAEDARERLEEDLPSGVHERMDSSDWPRRRT